ncbi:hypothetical protein NDU88_000917 [Pleurodeles waltl]|uniref:Uncharacterized protein n=1 Tax=Pleurodeles waltl TaxID=8319 RepID=A0AAV7Q8L3_PLEWA|nr:hypothetical protein NDU88_000917 [Pleurodeles waltl]
MVRAGHQVLGRQSCCHHWGPVLGAGWTNLDPPGRCVGVQALQGCVYFKLSNVAVFWSWVCILTTAVCTTNGIPRLNDRRVDSWVVMAWACLCWRDGGGLVISSLSLTADEAAFRGCRVFGGLAVVGQNDRGGLPRLRR